MLDDDLLNPLGDIAHSLRSSIAFVIGRYGSNQRVPGARSRAQPSCVAIMDALKAGPHNTNSAGVKVRAKLGHIAICL
jgi:hypothetical protein